MAKGTRVTELRKEVEVVKDQFHTCLENQARAEKTMEEMKLMMTFMFSLFQANPSQDAPATALTTVVHPDHPAPMPVFNLPRDNARMGFPHFFGEDLRAWIYRADQFFRSL